MVVFVVVGVVVVVVVKLVEKSGQQLLGHDDSFSGQPPCRLFALLSDHQKFVLGNGGLSAVPPDDVQGFTGLA